MLSRKILPSLRRPRWADPFRHLLLDFYQSFLVGLRDVFELPAVKLDDFPKVRGENKTYQLATTVTTTTTTATTTAHDHQILTPSRKYTQFRPLYLVPLFPYIRQCHDDPGDPQVDCRIWITSTHSMHGSGLCQNLPRPTKTLHCN